MKKKIVLEKQTEVRAYNREVRQILKMLGHPEALVTDESRVGDFLDVFATRRNAKQLEALREGLDIPVLMTTDRLWELGKEIREKRMKKTNKVAKKAVAKLDTKQELIKRINELANMYDNVIPFDSDDPQEHYLAVRCNSVRTTTRKEMAAAIIRSIHELWKW